MEITTSNIEIKRTFTKEQLLELTEALTSLQPGYGVDICFGASTKEDEKYNSLTFSFGIVLLDDDLEEEDI